MRASALLMSILVLLLAGCAGSRSGDIQADPDASGSARVRGSVQDDQLRPLSGVEVRATAAVASTNATSGPDGGYDLGLVPAGDYRLQASIAGFATTTRRLIVRGGEDQAAVNLLLAPLPTASPHFKMEPKSIHIDYAIAYQVGGDFNRGCISPGISCQGFSYPAPHLAAFTDDPEQTPLETVMLEEVWTANSPVCAKAIAIDLYNPDAPSTMAPSLENPHYWTNYPHERWSTKSPVVMTIPRTQPSDADAMEDPKRIERNGGPLFLRGNWTVRHFPPGAGLTNQPIDANCFTDQKFDIYWTAFYGMTPAPTYQGRP